MASIKTIAIALTAVLADIGGAAAQGMLPSTGSTAGVTTISPSRSIKPQETTPTDTYRPRPFPPAWERNNSIPGAAIAVFGR